MERNSRRTEDPDWVKQLPEATAQPRYKERKQELQGVGWLATWLLLISLTLAISIQHRQISRLNEELEVVHQQVGGLLLDQQPLPFDIPQQSGSPIPATQLLVPTPPPDEALLMCQTRTQVEEGEEGRQADQNTWWSRSLAAALLVVQPTDAAFEDHCLAVVVGSSAYGYTRLDQMPEPVRKVLNSLLVRADYQSQPFALSKLLAYSADGWFSTNPYSKTLALGFLTVYIVFLGTLTIYFVTGDSLYAAFWQAVAGVGIDWTFADETDVPFGTVIVRIAAAAISIGGMLITALMLGLISDAISSTMESWKKGHSDVLETQHTLILGWSDKVLSLVDQICLANASEGGRPIVILAEREKEEMEDAFRKHVLDCRGSTIICRSGNPLLSVDLDRVSLSTARSAIVLASPSDGPDRSDARVLRIVLSLMVFFDRVAASGGGMLGHIVAEISDLDNEPLVRMVGEHCVHTIVSHDIIGRLMIQCARQPGLAAVWEKIMGFDGDEFYCKEWPELVGMPFSDVLISFPLATPLGVESDGKVILNPEPDYILKPADKVLVLSEDDDSYEPCATLPDLSEERAMTPEEEAQPRPEKMLFCGWRRDMHDMILVLDEFVAPGSELWLYNDVPVEEREQRLLDAGLDVKDLQHLTLVYEDNKVEGELVSRKHLEELDPKQFSSILLLADSQEGTDMTDADSRNLATLLLLRDIQAQALGLIRSCSGSVSVLVPAKAPNGAPQNGTGHRRVSMSIKANTAWLSTMQDAIEHTVIISEILDPRTRHLIQDLHVSEYVLSNELVSMALAMAAESPMVKVILSELFVAEGNELYIEPASQYIMSEEQVCFYTIMTRARERRKIAIGYKQWDAKVPEINPKSKAARILDLAVTESIVIMAHGAS